MGERKTIKDKIKTILNKWSYSREKGLDKELSFWKRWMETKGLEWKEDFQFRFDSESKLIPRVFKLVDQLNKDQTYILDIGAGPVTRIGYKHSKSAIELQSCDPLADRYNKLLEEQKLQPPVRTEQVHGEELIKKYGADKFDIATAMNCLDHSEEPLVIIKQMVAVVKDQGLIYLCHAQNEAITENYQGLHRWNFYLNEKQEFEMQSLNEQYNLNKELDGLTIECNMENDMIHVYIKVKKIES